MIAIGLQCGFGTPLGRPVLDELRALGFTIVRLDLQESTQDDTTALAQEVLDAGLQPLCIIARPEQMLACPDGCLIEVGNEPDLEHFGWTVESYIEVGNECVKLAREHHRRLYLGVVSNLNARGFNFLRQLPWDEWTGDGICCSIHRYPEGQTPQTPHTGWPSREAEVHTLREIVGNRPLACTEVGYHELAWTQAEVADNMAWERQFFEGQGFELVSAYQVNDSYPTDPEPVGHYGFRRADGTWKAVAFAFANTIFPPLAGVVITLKSHHARFLSVPQNQIVVANRDEAEVWERFQVEMLGGNQIALRSWQWQYATSELDTTVHARATTIGPWETWTYEVLDDDHIALKADDGNYLTAELDGSVAVRAEDVGPWETWVSDPPRWWVRPADLTNGNRLHGVLTRHNRVVYDESGVQTLTLGTNTPMRQPRILMFCHFMEAFSAWCHGREREVLDQCKAIARHYGGVRVLDVLGYWDVAWGGKEVTPIAFQNRRGDMVPPTPRYWEQKRTFVTMLHGLGLKIMDDRGDLNTWSRSEKIEHMRQNGEFYASLPIGRDVLAGVWAGNEGWQNGVDNIDLAQGMVQAFREGAGWLPALCGLSAPGGTSDPLRLANCTPPMTDWEPEMPCSFVNWSLSPGTVLTIHGNRGYHEHIIEHYFAYGYDETMRRTNKVAFNTEPVGPGNGVSVGRVNDAELLCGLTLGALIGGQAWTYMSGFGVFWDGPIDSQVGFEEVARLTTFLPQDIATWPTVIHGGTRFRGLRILAANDPTRCEHALASDGRFALLVHTHGPGNPVVCERSCAIFTVVHPVTGQVERTGPLHTGESYTHTGTVRLVVGQLV